MSGLRRPRAPGSATDAGGGPQGMPRSRPLPLASPASLDSLLDGWPGPLPEGRWRSAEAPAKINLVLEVVGQRPDRYHELRSVFVPLALADVLRVRLAPPPRWPVRGDGPGIPVDRLRVLGVDAGPVEDNLVLRASDAVRIASGKRAATLPSLAFELRKRIPVAAGLGGGSSDAAAALRLSASAWGLAPTERRLVDLAAGLGSDVPFFVRRGWAFVGGRGERASPLPAPRGGPVGVVLVTLPVRLSTKAVFERFAAQRTRALGRAPEHAAGEPTASPARSLAARLRRGMRREELADIAPANDLWLTAAGLLPGLADLRACLARILDRPVHLSGSGPTLFVLYPSPADARRAAEALRAAADSGALPAPMGGPPGIVATRTWNGGGT